MQPDSQQDHPAAIKAALAVALSAFFLLAGYEFVRSPTNTLFKADWGAENLSTVLIFVVPAVALAVYLYAKVLTWCGPRKTLLLSTLGSVLAIVVCERLHQWGWRPATVILFLVRSVYIVLIIEQFWSFINSTLSVRQARRYNGIILGVSSLGSIAAGLIGSGLVESIGSAGMLLVGAAITVPAAILADRAMIMGGEPQASEQTESDAKQTEPKGALALSLFRTQPMLTVILAMVLLSQVVAAALMLHFQEVISLTFTDPDAETKYSYQVYSAINTAAMVGQFVVMPLLLPRIRPALWHIFIPAVQIAMAVWTWQSGSLMAVTAAYVSFKSLDYSVFRAAKEVLYIPFSFEARYRVKEIIDVVGYRVGKSGAAAMIDGLRRVGLSFGDGGYALIAGAAAATWVAGAVLLNRLSLKVPTEPNHARD